MMHASPTQPTAVGLLLSFSANGNTARDAIKATPGQSKGRARTKLITSQIVAISARSQRTETPMSPYPQADTHGAGYQITVSYG